MRKNVLKKTTKPNVYEVINTDGSKSYIVRFSYRGKTYPNKNFTKLFGSNTPTQAFNTLQEIKVMLSNGQNPFEKVVRSSIDSYFDDYLKTLSDAKNRYVTETYYKKHIQPIIGNKDVGEIEKDHLQKILNGTLKELSDRSKKTLKIILNPILERAIREDKRAHNPLKEINFKKPKPKRELTSRVSDELPKVAQKLYQAISALDNIELKTVFLIGLMTARRRSEILKLEWTDIKNNKVFVPEEITKSNHIDEYPLPIEIIKLLKRINHASEKIFTIKPDRVTRNFTKLLTNIGIDFVKNQKMTFHDTRNLFQSIMILETLNPHLVDRCLSHNQDGSILSVYLSFSYDKRKEVFAQYWEILRKT